MSFKVLEAKLWGIFMTHLCFSESSNVNLILNIFVVVSLFHGITKYETEFGENSLVLISPSRGVLLCVFWMAIILIMYFVLGFRPEEKRRYSK